MLSVKSIFSLNAPETQYMPLLPAEDCLEEPSEGIEAHLLCHRHAPRPMCNSEIVDSAMENIDTLDISFHKFDIWIWLVKSYC